MAELKSLVIICLLLMIPFALGVYEKFRNDKNTKQLKVRVNVNGIRGKSTATRMTAALLKEAGYRVVGKTTGTAARLTYWDQEEEEEIKRQPRGVSISEQIKVINKAVKHGADAIVCECMAVRPEYQKVYEHQILKGNIVIIVNVVEDHLDEMGPTLTQLAWAFADTIPYNGYALIPDCEFTELFKKTAAERNSEAIVIHPEVVPEEFLKKYDYMLFPNNIACPLGVAKALNIPYEVALKGMLKAHPDPGATRAHHIVNGDFETWFINGFAANEPESTLEIWRNYMLERKINLQDAVIVMNCRPDRVDRSKLFAEKCIPAMGPVHLFVIGEQCHPFTSAQKAGYLDNLQSMKIIEDKGPDNESQKEKYVEHIMHELVPLLNGHAIFGVGNIHGVGGAFMDALFALGEDDNRDKSTMDVSDEEIAAIAEEIRSREAEIEEWEWYKEEFL